MFKFVALVFAAVLAIAFAAPKPGVVTSYTAPVVGYSSPYVSTYAAASPYVSTYGASPYYGATYGAAPYAYSAYGYGAAPVAYY